MKVIRINTPEGQYQIELQTVAEDRAEYYSEKDDFEMGSMECDEEVNLVLGDTFEGIDWLISNSDWDDWEPVAKKLNGEVETTDPDFWYDSDNFEINTI
jgi:hypothetical protein